MGKGSPSTVRTPMHPPIILVSNLREALESLDSQPGVRVWPPRLPGQTYRERLIAAGATPTEDDTDDAGAVP